MSTSLSWFALAKSTYYDWINNGKKTLMNYNLVPEKQVYNAFIDTGKIYGKRRITIMLNNKFKTYYSPNKVGSIMKRLSLKPYYYVQKKNKKIKPEKIGKYDQLFKGKQDFDKFNNIFSCDITEEKFGNKTYYTCAFYDVKNPKIYGETCREYKGNKLVLESFGRFIDEFGAINLNSIIHTDNGSEFKSYLFKLATMYFSLKISMWRVGKSTDNGYIEGYWSVKKRESKLPYQKFKTLDDYAYNAKLYNYFYNNQRIRIK